jgi:hypothetical protein
MIEGVIWIDPERQGGEPCFINTVSSQKLGAAEKCRAEK